MIFLVALSIAGWAAAAILGTQAYFLGEQTKPIHRRNWRSPAFHGLAEVITGRSIDATDRASDYRRDLYLSRLVSRFTRG